MTSKEPPTTQDEKTFRPLVFWCSDLANAVDQVQVAADEYPPDERVEFLEDVARELQRLANELNA